MQSFIYLVNCIGDIKATVFLEVKFEQKKWKNYKNSFDNGVNRGTYCVNGFAFVKSKQTAGNQIQRFERKDFERRNCTSDLCRNK